MANDLAITDIPDLRPAYSVPFGPAPARPGSLGFPRLAFAAGSPPIKEGLLHSEWFANWFRSLRPASNEEGYVEQIIAFKCDLEQTEAARRLMETERSSRHGGKSEGLDSNPPPSADAVVECEFHAQTPAGFDFDAKRPLMIGKQRFKLRIAFEALGHVGHGRAR